MNNTEDPKWYLSKTTVLVLLFFVLGPFALPLLYKSPKFSNGSKVFLTLLFAVYIGIIIHFTLKEINAFNLRMQEIDRMLGR